MVTKIEQTAQPPTRQRDEVESSGQEFREILLSGPMPPDYVAIDWPPAVPHEALLGSVCDGRLRVQLPIRVKFTQEGQNIIAKAVEFNEFGFGENPSEALVDLQHAIAELYFTLDKEHNRLGRDLQRVWAKLQKKIRKL